MKCKCGHGKKQHHGEWKGTKTYPEACIEKSADGFMCACLQFDPVEKKPRKLTVTIVAAGLTRSDYAKSITWNKNVPIPGKGYDSQLVIDWSDDSTDTVSESNIDSLLVTPK